MLKRTKLTEEIRTRLRKINGQSPYVNAITDVIVKEHRWDYETESVQRLPDPPAIILEWLPGRSVSSATTEWAKEVAIDIRFLMFGGSADADEIDAALADIERALFTDENGEVDTFFGIGASDIEMTERMIEPDEGAPEDGVVVTLALKYQDEIGAPIDI